MITAIVLPADLRQPIRTVELDKHDLNAYRPCQWITGDHHLRAARGDAVHGELRRTPKAYRLVSTRF
jgi:hypothetical protein